MIEYVCSVCKDLSWRDQKQVESKCFVCDRPGVPRWSAPAVPEAQLAYCYPFFGHPPVRVDTET